MRRLFTQQLTGSGRITLHKERGDENTSDIGIKVLALPTLTKSLDMLNIGEWLTMRERALENLWKH